MHLLLTKDKTKKVRISWETFFLNAIGAVHIGKDRWDNTLSLSKKKKEKENSHTQPSNFDRLSAMDISGIPTVFPCGKSSVNMSQVISFPNRKHKSYWSQWNGHLSFQFLAHQNISGPDSSLPPWAGAPHGWVPQTSASGKWNEEDPGATLTAHFHQRQSTL